MKFVIFFGLMMAVLFVSGCGSPADTNQPTANVQNTNLPNTNLQPANTAVSPAPGSSPVTESSPGGESSNLSGANYPEIVQNIHQRVNEYRQSQGLPPLELVPVISEQARDHSREMAENPNTISHRKFDDRISDIRKQLSFSGASENVAANLNYPEPGIQAVEGWIKSPSHRKNMLGDYTQTGIGVYKTENDRYFFTQIYWKP